MPVLAGRLLTPPPTTPPRRPGKLPPKRFIWTSPAGDVLDLTGGQGYNCLPGREGFGVTPRSITQNELPGGGASLQSIRDQSRVMAVPLQVRGATQAEYLERRRRLFAAVRHPVRDGLPVPGTLTVALPDGTRRSIAAYYNGGLSHSEEVLDDLKLKLCTFPNLEFLALDPDFESGQVSAGWRTAPGRAFFGTMPLVLSASQVLGAVQVVLPGDADSYPIWKITGPGVPTIVNNTSGRSFALSPAVDAGRVVTVDTRPDQLTVTDDLGTDLYDYLDTWPDLWPLEPGLNELTVEMASSTSASRVEFTAAVRWQSAW